MVVVFLPEVTLCLVDLGKFVSFIRELLLVSIHWVKTKVSLCTLPMDGHF